MSARQTWMVLRCDGCQLLVRRMLTGPHFSYPEHHDAYRGFPDGCEGEFWPVCTHYGDGPDVPPEIRATAEIFPAMPKKAEREARQ